MILYLKFFLHNQNFVFNVSYHLLDAFDFCWKLCFSINFFFLNPWTVTKYWLQDLPDQNLFLENQTISFSCLAGCVDWKRKPRAKWTRPPSLTCCLSWNMSCTRSWWTNWSCTAWMLCLVYTYKLVLARICSWAWLYVFWGFAAFSSVHVNLFLCKFLSFCLLFVLVGHRSISDCTSSTRGNSDCWESAYWSKQWASHLYHPEKDQWHHSQEQRALPDQSSGEIAYRQFLFCFFFTLEFDKFDN